MMGRALLLAGIGLVSAAAAAALAGGGGSESAAEVTVLGEPLTPEELVRGEEVYAEACASCHGADLEGQPDWKRRLPSGRMPAPPHDESGHTWHHSDQDLIAITRDGVAAVVSGYESDMPAFGGTLSGAEIAAVLGYIKSTWPERQRTFQAEVTANAEDGS